MPKKPSPAPAEKSPCKNFFDHSPTWRDFAHDLNQKFDEKSKDYKDFMDSLEVLAAILNEGMDTYKNYYFQYKSKSAGGFFAFDKLIWAYDRAHKVCQGTPSGAFPPETAAAE